MARWSRVVGAVGFGLLSVQALAAPLPGFALAGQTAHIRFYARSDQDRQISMKESEKRLVQLTRTLGEQSVPSADLYQYVSAGDLASVHGAYAGGLTFPDLGEVHTTPARRDHELVHLVAAQLGDPGAFFQEGLAVALGDDGRYQGQDVDRTAARYARRAPLAELIAAFRASDPGAGYAVAGSFVRDLIRTQGMDRVAAFFRSCKTSPMPAAFEANFGASLDQAGAAWTSRIAR
jgi:hypothetical protein